MQSKNNALTRRTFCVAGAMLGVSSMSVLAGCSGSPEPEGSSADSAPAMPPDQKSGAEADVASSGVAEKLYIVDTIKPKPGEGKAFLDDYLATYVPLAKKAGMSLVGCMISPPIWIDTDSNTLQATWTVDDIAVAAWAMNSATRYDPAYVSWWSSVRDRVVSLDRSYYATESYMEVLNNV